MRVEYIDLGRKKSSHICKISTTILLSYFTISDGYYKYSSNDNYFNCVSICERYFIRIKKNDELIMMDEEG